MAIDIGSKTDRDRLHKAKLRSRDLLELYDRRRTSLIRDYAGTLYSPVEEGVRRYVNKLNTTANIYAMALAFQTPQCKITSFQQKLWPFCRKYETNVNKVAANIDLRSTFQEGVLDAFFLLGVFKTRMADAGLKEIEPNVYLDPGKPWVDRVSFSDLILDMPGKSLRSMRFYGDRYRASWEGVKARAGEDFEAAVVRQMTPSSKFNQEANSDRADSIETGNMVDDDELEPMVWLEDVWLPQTEQFVTFAADNDTLPPLSVKEGKEVDFGPQGPYDFLAFGYVPDNIMPSTPAQNLALLDRLSNRLYRKLSNQADRQKNIVAVDKGDEADAQIAKDAKDGEYVTFRNTASLKPIQFPGVDGNTHAFFLAAAEVYNTQSGNERAIGGLGEEAGTLGQEQLIQGHAGGRVGFMKAAVYQCASNVLRKIGSLMWEDESLKVDSSMEVENTGYHIDTSWKPGDREGLKDHYEFSVEPNSMSYMPPEMKLQKLYDFIGKYVMVQPAIQAGLIDGVELARITAEYENMPEIVRIVKQLQQAGQEIEGDHGATKAPVTTRENVRKNVSKGPQGQGMQAVMGQMMQGKQQPMMAGAK